MCNASNKTELIKEVELAVNNIAKSTSKEVAQADFDPLNLSDSSMFQASSHQIISPELGKPIENARKLHHFNESMMSKLAPKREMKICVSECPNMFLDNESCGEDTRSPRLEETKSHLEGTNSSRRTRMTVGELDRVDELSMGGCSSIGSNMDLDEQFINSEPEVTGMSKGNGQDYSMLSAFVSTGISATRNVVYKLSGTSTRKCSLKTTAPIENNLPRG